VPELPKSPKFEEAAYFGDFGTIGTALLYSESAPADGVLEAPQPLGFEQSQAGLTRGEAAIPATYRDAFTVLCAACPAGVWMPLQQPASFQITNIETGKVLNIAHVLEVIIAVWNLVIFRISEHHLVKVAHFLGQHGILANTRGRNGGLRFARPAREISVGQVVRLTEGRDMPAECFDPRTNTCRLAGDCRLRGMLAQAVDGFYAALEGYTVADLRAPRGIARLVRLTSINTGPA